MRHSSQCCELTPCTRLRKLPLLAPNFYSLCAFLSLYLLPSVYFCSNLTIYFGFQRFSLHFDEHALRPSAEAGGEGAGFLGRQHTYLVVTRDKAKVCPPMFQHLEAPIYSYFLHCVFIDLPHDY